MNKDITFENLCVCGSILSKYTNSLKNFNYRLHDLEFFPAAAYRVIASKPIQMDLIPNRMFILGMNELSTSVWWMLYLYIFRYPLMEIISINLKLTNIQPPLITSFLASLTSRE